MSKTLLQACLSILLCGNLVFGMGGTAAIGTILARGPFQLDQSQLTGSATLFEGSVVRTGQAPSELELAGGSRVRLSADSTGRIYRDRLVLEQGQGQLDDDGAYGIEARSLRLRPESTGSSARVLLLASNRVQMHALRGRFLVTNAQGVLLARLGAGEALEFDQPDGAAATTRVQGLLVKRDGYYFLTDETTKVTVQLEGAVPDSLIGQNVEVVGTINPRLKPAAPASEVVVISSARRFGGGVSRNRIIIAGVGVAAAGGIAAGVALLGGDSKPAASR